MYCISKHILWHRVVLDLSSDFTTHQLCDLKEATLHCSELHIQKQPLGIVLGEVLASPGPPLGMVLGEVLASPVPPRGQSWGRRHPLSSPGVVLGVVSASPGAGTHRKRRGKPVCRPRAPTRDRAALRGAISSSPPPLKPKPACGEAVWLRPG